MKHTHHDIIVAWAADTSKVVQCRSRAEHDWEDCHGGVIWLTPLEYRLKPDPVPDVVVYLEVDVHGASIQFEQQTEQDNLRLTFDGETGKLKSAEVLK